MKTATFHPALRVVLGAALLITVAFLTQQSAFAGSTTIQVGDIWFCDESFENGVCETTIGVGDTIVWEFDGTFQPHTTTACGASCDDPTLDPAWNSGILGDGSTFEYTFTVPGTYLYYCQVHPTLQRGVIIVQGGATQTPPTTVPPTTVPPTAVPPTVTPAGQTGDVNCNGNVDAIDAALVLQFTAGLVGSLSCQENADANDDGTINAIDAALILQFSAGLVGTLPP